jgi:enoyl-CoA hydratase
MANVALTVEKKDFIAEVVLRGPGKGNALGPDFWRECPQVFDALDRDDSVRAIILRGHGGTFTYGLDLRSMMSELGPLTTGEILAAERSKLLALVGELQNAPDSIERCKKPVVCAIAGWCIGGGVDIAAACDVRLGSKDAKISVREVKVAMVADIGSLQRLPRIIGQGMTRELALTGDDIDANEALRIGLLNHVYEDENALLEAARAMAKRMAENPPLVVQGVKEVLNYCADKSIADGERFVAVWNSAFLASHDLFEAIGAFSEKRQPRFTGR